jgi:hypothetical protein
MDLFKPKAHKEYAKFAKINRFNFEFFANFAKLLSHLCG